MPSPILRDAVTLDREAVRSWFPTLKSDFAYLENAGGSQVPRVVADAIRDYMLSDYVQLGAGYGQSVRATAVVGEAHRFIERFMNAEGIGKVILGSSTTALLHMLADSYADVWKMGDEVIVAETNHEANAGPWTKLQKRGIVIKYWKVDPESFQCSLQELLGLITDRTKIVAFPHVSNLLGDVVDVKSITHLVHAAGAKVVVDGVAYAPHRAIDVATWDVDWYVYSTYKVYGPHMAALYGKFDALKELTGPNHFFIPKDSIPYKFELGSLSHEGCAGLLGLRPYLSFLAQREVDDRLTVMKAFEAMEALEMPLQEQFLAYLRSKPSVRIIGKGEVGTGSVTTFSFVHKTLKSSEIVAEIDHRNIGIRFGHMYAVRLCKAIGINLEEGVVRVSMVHYNTPQEVERLIAALDAVI